MCDCLTSTSLPFSVPRTPNLGLNEANQRSKHAPFRFFYTPSCTCSSFSHGRLHFVRGNSHPSSRVSKNPGLEGSDECEFYREHHLELKSSLNDGGLKKFDENSTSLNDNLLRNAADSSGLDFLQLEEEKRSGNRAESVKEADLARIEGVESSDSGQLSERAGLRRAKQVMRRSNLLAKQVISIQSALSLGFVSQLWVDTTSWVVLVVEVRPNLLSGDSEKFLLEDVSQVGDFVLVENESVMESEFKMIGLETLVGYRVVTPGRRNIGKVRGYTFNINSGAIESLELDSFGISIIPSSLVSTYALLVDDVLEVLPDTVVVHEAAASRIQRLTKGLLDTQNAGGSLDELEEYYFERPVNRCRSSQESSNSRKFRRRTRVTEDDWELPMDYL